jgi:hypothetical protein
MAAFFVEIAAAQRPSNRQKYGSIFDPLAGIGGTGYAVASRTICHDQISRTWRLAVGDRRDIGSRRSVRLAAHPGSSDDQSRAPTRRLRCCAARRHARSVGILCGPLGRHSSCPIATPRILIDEVGAAAICNCETVGQSNEESTFCTADDFLQRNFSFFLRKRPPSVSGHFRQRCDAAVCCTSPKCLGRDGQHDDHQHLHPRQQLEHQSPGSHRRRRVGAIWRVRQYHDQRNRRCHFA